MTTTAFMTPTQVRDGIRAANQLMHIRLTKMDSDLRGSIATALKEASDLLQMPLRINAFLVVLKTDEDVAFQYKDSDFRAALKNDLLFSGWKIVLERSLGKHDEKQAWQNGTLCATLTADEPIQD